MGHWKAKAIEWRREITHCMAIYRIEYGYLGFWTQQVPRADRQEVIENADGAYNMAHIYLYSGDVDAARRWFNEMAEHSEDF